MKGVPRTAGPIRMELVRLSAVTALTRSCAVLTYRDTDGPEGRAPQLAPALLGPIQRSVCAEPEMVVHANNPSTRATEAGGY